MTNQGTKSRLVAEGYVILMTSACQISEDRDIFIYIKSKTSAACKESYSASPIYLSQPALRGRPLVEEASQDILDLAEQLPPTVKYRPETFIGQVVYVLPRQVIRYDVKVPKLSAAI